MLFGGFYFYRREVNQLSLPFPECAPVDLLIIADASTNADWAKTKTFLHSFGNELPIGTGVNDAAVALSSFAQYHRVQRQLDAVTAYTNDVNAWFQTTEFGRNVSGALLETREYEFVPSKGDRDSVADAVLLITSGDSTVATFNDAEEAGRTHARNINTFAVGVGGTTDSFLNTIAEDPDTDHKMYFATYDALIAGAKDVREMICAQMGETEFVVVGYELLAFCERSKREAEGMTK